MSSSGVSTAKPPPSIYSALWWEIATRIGGMVPRRPAVALAGVMAELHRWLDRGRASVVLANQLPLAPGDRALAIRRTRQLYRSFAGKLIDLWRFESGLLPVEESALSWGGREHFEQARRSGQGVLLVSMHLGNWEIGAALLAKRGEPVWVVTAQEPDSRLTRKRELARERWGIRTLVMGQDQFGFMAVVERLRAGEIVALLVDRPPVSQLERAPFLGGEIGVSLGPALLARATGCAVLPVAIVAQASGYQVIVGSPVTHDARLLSSRQGRTEFLCRMAASFEQWVLDNPTQWYHFVPVWLEQAVQDRAV